MLNVPHYCTQLEYDEFLLNVLGDQSRSIKLNLNYVLANTRKYWLQHGL